MMRRWIPFRVIASLAVPGCLKRDKGNNGKKGQDHNLVMGNVILGFNFQRDPPVTEVLFGDVPADSFVVRSNT